MLQNLHRAAAIAAACAASCATAASAADRPDPQIGSQWALQGDGPMGAATAWTRITGGDVTVAVVDTGVDLAHRDLAPNLWTNPGEVPGNGVDDDGDGFVDDVHGADFVNRDGDPTDDNGHGTHVAGIVAARGNNGVGVAGLAWRARIMAVKVLGADASGDMAAVAEGVRYAVAHGARVINLSLTGPSPGADLAAAVAAAAAANVLVVAAAGNTHVDDDGSPTYPAALDAPNLVAVTSSDQRGRLARVGQLRARHRRPRRARRGDPLHRARRRLRAALGILDGRRAGVAARPCCWPARGPALGWSGHARRPAGLGAADLAAGRRRAPDVAGALRRVLGAPRERSRVSAKRASAGRLRRHSRRPRSRVAVARAAVPR